MNLFIILIPFLLMTAAFVELAIVHSALTERGTGGASGDGAVQVLPIIEVNKKGFVLVSRTCDLDHLLKEGKRLAGSGKVVIKTHDLDRLTELLVKIREASPDERALSIAPEPNVPYQLLIRTMDTVRERQVEDKRDVMFTNVAFAPDRLK